VQRQAFGLKEMFWPGWKTLGWSLDLMAIALCSAIAAVQSGSSHRKHTFCLSGLLAANDPSFLWLLALNRSPKHGRQIHVSQDTGLCQLSSVKR